MHLIQHIILIRNMNNKLVKSSISLNDSILRMVQVSDLDPINAVS